jgi:hypothetical protein
VAGVMKYQTKKADLIARGNTPELRFKKKGLFSPTTIGKD